MHQQLSCLSSKQNRRSSARATHVKRQRLLGSGWVLMQNEKVLLSHLRTPLFVYQLQRRTGSHKDNTGCRFQQGNAFLKRM